MGTTDYSTTRRFSKASSEGYFTKGIDDVFEQNKKRQIHEQMNPKLAILRESRDSEIHPNSVPLLFGLDVTASMHKIPHYLVKDGLPKMMSSIIESGVPDPQVLFLAIGDHKVDSFPLQVGQFESGDDELDLWLTRTYLEGGGGGNGGESYLLAWYFAAYHTITDSWEKRHEKGFLFTTGDEPCHTSLPNNTINEIMGRKPEASFTDKELLAAAREKYHVYHLHILEGSQGRNSLSYWKDLLGENCIAVEHHHDVPKIVADIVTSIARKTEAKYVVDMSVQPSSDSSPVEIIL